MVSISRIESPFNRKRGRFALSLSVLPFSVTTIGRGRSPAFSDVLGTVSFDTRIPLFGQGRVPQCEG